MKREICLVLAVLAGSAAVTAQDVPGRVAVAPPAVKMGLWQNTVTNTMTGLQIPPEVAARMQAMGRQMPGAAPRTTVTQSCLTPEKWQKAWSDMVGKNSNCQFSNLQQTATSMSGDIACTTPEGLSKGHMEATFSGQEKANGKMHMDITTKRQEQPIVMDVVFESVYQGSDCKGIEPGDAKVVR
jgi:hypothetical protein